MIRPGVFWTNLMEPETSGKKEGFPSEIQSGSVWRKPRYLKAARFHRTQMIHTFTSPNKRKLVKEWKECLKPPKFYKFYKKNAVYFQPSWAPILKILNQICTPHPPSLFQLAKTKAVVHFLYISGFYIWLKLHLCYFSEEKYSCRHDSVGRIPAETWIFSPTVLRYSPKMVPECSFDGTFLCDNKLHF